MLPGQQFVPPSFITNFFDNTQNHEARLYTTAVNIEHTISSIDIPKFASESQP